MGDFSLHKEIDLIQNCINRMANNSFILKGWVVSILAVVLSLAINKFNSLFLLCSVLIPLFCFWWLDAFFLRKENMYRKMYEWVLIERKNGNLDFQYDLNPNRFKKEVPSFCEVMFSKTLFVFYGVPFIIFLFIALFDVKDVFCGYICGC